MGLYLPEGYKYTMPKPVPPEERFSPRLFTCCHHEDVEDFKKECEKLGAIYCGEMRIDFLNVWNQAVGFGSYACVYQYKEDISISVRC